MATNQRLTSDQITALRDARAAGESVANIAKRLGVSPGTVSNHTSAARFLREAREENARLRADLDAANVELADWRAGRRVHREG